MKTVEVYMVFDTQGNVQDDLNVYDDRFYGTIEGAKEALQDFPPSMRDRFEIRLAKIELYDGVVKEVPFEMPKFDDAPDSNSTVPVKGEFDDVEDPTKFYFKLCVNSNDPNLPTFYFAITPTAYFDRENKLFQNGFPTMEYKLSGLDLIKIGNSLFEVDVNNSSTTVRQTLLNLGFVENSNLPDC